MACYQICMIAIKTVCGAVEKADTTVFLAIFFAERPRTFAGLSCVLLRLIFLLNQGQNKRFQPFFLILSRKPAIGTKLAISSLTADSHLFGTTK